MVMAQRIGGGGGVNSVVTPQIQYKNKISSEEFEMLQDDLVNPTADMNVVEIVQGEYDSYYVVKDEAEETAHFVDASGVALTGSFSYGDLFLAYAADTDKNGADELYVRTNPLGSGIFSSKLRPWDVAYAFDLSSFYFAEPSTSWQELDGLEIPYHFGFLTSGCFQTGPITVEKPMTLSVSGEALILKNRKDNPSYILTPSVLAEPDEPSMTSFRTFSYFPERYFNCAYQAHDDAATREQIRNALIMARSAPRSLDNQLGPYEFLIQEPIEFKYDDRRVSLTPYGDKTANVVELDIAGRPELHVNRAGLIYVHGYDSGASSMGSSAGSGYYHSFALEEGHLDFLTRALESFLESDSAREDGAAVQQLLDIVQTGEKPEWLRE